MPGNGSTCEPALVGRRATWTRTASCGARALCRDWHLPQQCEHLFKYGQAVLDKGSGLDGCYASHLLIRAGSTVLTVPDSLPDALVAPANCALATIVNATEVLPAGRVDAVFEVAGTAAVVPEGEWARAGRRGSQALRRELVLLVAAIAHYRP